MGLHPQIAQKRIDEAAEQIKAVGELLREQENESRRAYESFYNNLALFSGGTVALSVTYLGYLKSLSSQPSGKYLLIGSWSFLFICLLTSLFWSFFYSYYGYFARSREYFEARKKHREAEADGIRSLNIVNLTQQQLQECQAELREVAQKWESKAAGNRTKEDLYSQVWLWCGRVARVSFLFGIGLLLAFAVKNI